MSIGFFALSIWAEPNVIKSNTLQLTFRALPTRNTLFCIIMSKETSRYLHVLVIKTR